MSFKDASRFTSLQKLGCAAYAIVGILVSLVFMGSAALGDCPSENDCISETTRALMFYGAPLLTLLGGVLLARFFMRDKD